MADLLALSLDYSIPTRGICSYCNEPVDVDPGGFAGGHERYSRTLRTRITCMGTQEPVASVFPTDHGLNPDFHACYGETTSIFMDTYQTWHDCFGEIDTENI